jgi:hypothetical protein
VALTRSLSRLRISDVFVGGQQGQRVRLCDRDVHAVERIAVDGRKRGRRSRYGRVAGTSRKSYRSITATIQQEPVEGTGPR